MEIVKRVLFIVILLVMAVSLCSCLGASVLLKGIASSGEEIIKKETLAYMKEKYCGQEFVAVNVVEEAKHTIINCYPKGSDIETDPVRVERTIVDGDAEYRDTYFNILIREDLEADVQDMCKDLNLTMIVMFTGSSGLYVDNQFDGTKTYADYKEWEKDHTFLEEFDVYIYMEEDADFEKTAIEILDQLEDGGMYALLNMCFYPIDTYTEENIQNDMSGIKHTRIFKGTELS